METRQLTTIGFIGLGNMGGRMAKNLHNAGYPLMGYDIDAAKSTALVATGATAGQDAADVVKNSDVIMTSLRSSDIFCSVAEQHLIPNAREGHVFIDLGTTEVEKTRDIAMAFTEKGATLIDAPVSGGTPRVRDRNAPYLCRWRCGGCRRMPTDFRSARGTEVRGLLRSERFRTDR